MARTPSHGFAVGSARRRRSLPGHCRRRGQTRRRAEFARGHRAARTGDRRHPYRDRRGSVARQFHLEIAAAAQSPRLTREEVRLQSERGGLLWLPLEAHGTRENAYAEHRAITAAIAQGDGELARKLTEEHILEAIDRLADVHLALLDP
ncbi:FCD domain-containing protein [Amycolatopsis sp. cmx-11-32]|uniref:FCD domain-containing protein n=1 Tax=Amycolatopsis sp. cmx-11-32 TaxID=2785796 RepID=UPI0039E4F3A5